jgi:hypothetical protein
MAGTPAQNGNSAAGNTDSSRRTLALLGVDIAGHGLKLTGWPTPIVNDATGSTHCYGPVRPDGTRAEFLKLPGVAALAGWPTPTTLDVIDRPNGLRPSRIATNRSSGYLAEIAPLAGWATPMATDGSKADATLPVVMRRLEDGRQMSTAMQARMTEGAARLTSTGELLTGSDAEMSDGGRLNPRHACWLMGYPHEWDDIAQTVTLPPRGRASRAKAGKPGG